MGSNCGTLLIADPEMKDYIELTKPRITWLILMSTGIGYFFGLPAGAFSWMGWPSWLQLLATLVGTALIASGSAALNQWYERDSDFMMRRTKTRPIPGGRMLAKRALIFGWALALAGFLILSFGVNYLSGLLGLITLLCYLFVYTPMKQRSSLSTVVGALPGAMPPIIGYAAASGELTSQAWALFAILFVWQFPHFLAIAWMYRRDYHAAGLRMLPGGNETADDRPRSVVGLLACGYAAVLVPVSL